MSESNKTDALAKGGATTPYNEMSHTPAVASADLTSQQKSPAAYRLRQLMTSGQATPTRVAELLATLRTQDDRNQVIGELQSDQRFGNHFVQLVVRALPSQQEHETPTTSSGGRDHARDSGLEFGAREHKAYGDDAARSAGYISASSAGNAQETVSNFALTHGDIVMLTGDLFDGSQIDASKQHGNAEQLKKSQASDLHWLHAQKSSNPGKAVGTRDEVLFALFDAVGSTDARFATGGPLHKATDENFFSDDIKSTVKDRYLNRAAGNFDHFVAPKGQGSGGPKNMMSSGGSYRSLHENAIVQAYHAQRSGQPIDRSMQLEASAEHYLTDSFSAGHLRTPRESIQTYWDAKYPLFYENFKKTIAQDVAIYINANETNPTTLFGSVADIMATVIDGVDAATKTKPIVGIGSIVSALAHDDDNHAGLDVKDELGQRWRTFGDGDGGVKNSSEHQDTRSHVTQATAASIADVQHAFALPPSLTDSQVLHEVRAQTSAPAKASQANYGAEQLMPRLDKDKAAENDVQQWKQPTFATLWPTHIRAQHPATYGSAIVASLQAGDMAEQLDGLAASFHEIEAAPGASHVHPRQAYQGSFLPQIKKSPQQKIQQIVDYDPARGQHATRTGDATVADINRSKQQAKAAANPPPGVEAKNGLFAERLRGLTFTQRVARNVSRM
jgi:hypothetical protein